VSIAFGFFVFDESPSRRPALLVLYVACLLVMVVGLRRLATAPPVDVPHPLVVGKG
jgi:hypothetical protein